MVACPRVVAVALCVSYKLKARNGDVKEAHVREMVHMPTGNDYHPDGTPKFTMRSAASTTHLLV